MSLFQSTKSSNDLKMKHAEYKSLLQADFVLVGFLYKVSTNKRFYI